MKRLIGIISVGLLGSFACERDQAEQTIQAERQGAPGTAEQSAPPGQGAPVTAPVDRQPVTGREAAEVPESVREFQSEVQRLSEGDPSRQHEQLAKALRSMSEALNDLPERPEAVNRAAGIIESQADRIEKDEAATTHANAVKAAFIDTVGALEAYRQRQPQIQGLSDSVSQVREASNAIDGERPLMEQRDQVQKALRSTSEALVMASQNAPRE